MANITVVSDDPTKLVKLAQKFRSLAKKRNDRIFDVFGQRIGTNVELIDIRMHRTLSVYVGCQSRKSVHLLDSLYESGNLCAVIRECLCIIDDIDVKGVHWEAADFNKCIQYFRTLSG